MRQYSINSRRLLFIFVSIFPIIPTYFSVLGFGAINLWALLFVISVLVINRGKISCPQFKVSGLSIALVVWMVGNIIALSVSDSITQSIYFVLQTVLLFGTILPIVKQRCTFLRCIEIIVYTSGVLACFGIIEELTKFNIFSLLNTTGATLNYNPVRFGVLRIISYSSQTIVYGVYVMFCMTLNLYYLQFVPNNTKKRKRFIFIYVLLVLNLLLTLSRSTILAVVLSQILFLFFCGFKKMVLTVLKLLLVGGVLLTALCLIVPKVRIAMSNIIFMILALIDGNYTSMIAESFGDNLRAVGNRTDLYQWVFQSMNDHWIWGYGQLKNFVYYYTQSNDVYSWTATKNGIEVQYLNILYHKGLVGMISEIAVYIMLLFESFRKRRKATWEKKIGFNAVALSLFISYFLLFFAVNQSSDRLIFYIIVMLFLAYNYYKKYEDG